MVGVGESPVVMVGPKSGKTVENKFGKTWKNHHCEATTRNERVGHGWRIWIKVQTISNAEKDTQ
jgi:hypothetical protein